MQNLLLRSVSFGLISLLVACAPAEPAPSESAAQSAPPAVGVVQAVRRPVTESYEFMGRVQATDRVDLVARVNAFLEKRLFTEGAEVKKHDLLYVLEQAPYQADLAVRQAAVAQAEAQLENANIHFVRAKKLVQALAGSQERYDDALATQRSAAAQLRSAHAAEQQSQINLDYTEIRAPIDGRIGRSSMTIGNVVGPGSGTLATIVSQDPMYVAFPVPVRTAIELRNRIAAKGGFDSVAIKVRLPDGSMYDHSGRLNFADVTIGPDTDTLILRGSFPNPVQSRMQLGASSLRALDDGAFVTVVVESATPVELLALPREAVLSDQRGDFVYIVDAENTVERRSVQLGQSTPATAVISNGLAEGDRVVLEGLQRVQAGMKVAPSPADADTRAADATAASGS